MKTFIDSTVFLGMHASAESVRVAAKNFFVERFSDTLYMTLEDVGMCDDVVWGFGHEDQDKYYPFMDRLHSVMRINRVPYSAEAIAALEQARGLTTKENLLLSMVNTSGGELYTLNNRLLVLGHSYIHAVGGEREELSFSEELEARYRASLQLSLDTARKS